MRRNMHMKSASYAMLRLSLASLVDRADRHTSERHRCSRVVHVLRRSDDHVSGTIYRAYDAHRRTRYNERPGISPTYRIATG